MITAQGYSKDPSIMPEGIAITFGKEMLTDHGGLKTFLDGFKANGRNDNEKWNNTGRSLSKMPV